MRIFFAVAFLRHEKTPTQIADNGDCDLRQVLNILTNDLMAALVGDDISAAHVNDFLQYFNHTWIGRLRSWNVYGLNKNRTNNHMEGWHSHLVQTINSNRAGSPPSSAFTLLRYYFAARPYTPQPKEDFNDNIPGTRRLQSEGDRCTRGIMGNVESDRWTRGIMWIAEC